VRSLFLGLSGSGDDLLEGFERIYGGGCPMMSRLGTKGAIFGTSTRFRIDDGAQLYALAENSFLQTVGSGKESAQFRPSGLKNGQSLLRGEAVSRQDPVGNVLQLIHRHS
jgi:hypothetical protein